MQTVYLVTHSLIIDEQFSDEKQFLIVQIQGLWFILDIIIIILSVFSISLSVCTIYPPTHLAYLSTTLDIGFSNFALASPLHTLPRSMPESVCFRQSLLLKLFRTYTLHTWSHSSVYYILYVYQYGHTIISFRISLSIRTFASFAFVLRSPFFCLCFFGYSSST